MTLNLNKLTAFIFSIFCFGVQTLMIGQSHQKQHLNIGNLSIEIESLNGRLDGDLIVRDTLHRDKILLSGRMHDNEKIGTWTLFDKKNPDKINLSESLIFDSKGIIYKYLHYLFSRMPYRLYQ